MSTSVYISLSDDKNILTVDGSLELLQKFIETIHHDGMPKGNYPPAPGPVETRSTPTDTDHISK